MRDIKRPVPLTEEWYQHCISDKVYTYLQIHAYKTTDEEGNIIYFAYDTPTLKEELGSIMKVSRKTINRRLKALMDNNFISKTEVTDIKGNKVPVYKLNNLDKYNKIKKDTLKYLTYFTNDDTIKVYNYLLFGSRFINEHYEFSIKEICNSVLNIGDNSKSARERVKTILSGLQKIGLIKLYPYRKVVATHDGSTTHLVVDKVYEDVVEEDDYYKF